MAIAAMIMVRFDWFPEAEVLVLMGGGVPTGKEVSLGEGVTIGVGAEVEAGVPILEGATPAEFGESPP